MYEKSPPYAMAILSYNHPEITRQVIESLYTFWSKHDIDPSKKIYLIHNGSLLKNANSLRSQFPNTHHLELKTNSGFTGGANFGMNEIFKLEPWVFFFTNDLRIEKLPLTLPLRTGFYAPKIFFRTLNRIDSIGGRFEPLWGKISHLKSESEFNEALAEKKLYIPGTAFLISKPEWGLLKGFDESLHTYWEDVDLSKRALRLNLNLGVIFDSELVHRVGKTCHKDSFYTLFLFQRNRRIICVRHSPFQILTWLLILLDHFRILFRFLRAKKWPQAKSLISTYFYS